MTKLEVIKSSHIYVQNHFENLNALSLHLVLVFSKFIVLILSSVFSSIKREILIECIKYWKKGLLKRNWKSDKVTRSNY